MVRVDTSGVVANEMVYHFVVTNNASVRFKHDFVGQHAFPIEVHLAKAVYRQLTKPVPTPKRFVYILGRRGGVVDEVDLRLTG